MAQSNQTPTKQSSFTINWVLGISLAIVGLGIIIKGSFLGGLLLGMVGVALIPPIAEKNKEWFPFWRNNILRRGALSFLAFIGLIISASSGGNKTTNLTANTTTNNGKNEVRIINLGKVYYDENGKKVVPDSNDITYKVVEILDQSKTEAPIEENNFENIHLLVELSNYDKELLEKIAFEIKDEYAKFAPNNCNIDLWDDKKAYQSYLDQQKFYTKSFDKLMTEFERTGVPIGEKHAQIKKEYDRKHYPFIADHLPASISLGNNFSYYQLQDNYYKEVGGKNFKK